MIRRQQQEDMRRRQIQRQQQQERARTETLRRQEAQRRLLQRRQQDQTRRARAEQRKQAPVDLMRFRMIQRSLTKPQTVTISPSKAAGFQRRLDQVRARLQTNGRSRSKGDGRSANPTKAAADSARTTVLNSPSAVTAERLAGVKIRLLAGRIARGHAFEKHVLQRGEFRGFIKTRKQFEDHVKNVIENPTATKSLSYGRTAYWHEKTRTVVIRDPRSKDGGTAFQPLNGRKYFEEDLR